MDFYDISVPISNTIITWPGDPPVSIRQTSSIAKGHSCNVSELKFSSHCGTHIDAPYHFEENGMKVDKIPLDSLIGKASVFHIEHPERIELQELKSLKLELAERVLFKTINSTFWKLSEFREDFVYLTKEAAQYLVECNIKLVGIDYLSLEQYESKDAETHHILLQNGIVIVEGLNLNNIKAGCYELIALPLRIQDCDGSPARVVLKSN